jgi:hypothetical protein
VTLAARLGFPFDDGHFPADIDGISLRLSSRGQGVAG